MAILETVKKALLIPTTETYADDELISYIDACKDHLRTSGVVKSIIDQEHPIVTTLCIIYAKTFFGFKSDGSVKELPKSFDTLLSQIALSKSDHHVSE